MSRTRKRRLSRRTRARFLVTHLNLAEPLFSGKYSDDSDEEKVYERMEEDDDVDEEVHEFEKRMQDAQSKEKWKRKWWKHVTLWKTWEPKRRTDSTKQS